jgi:hypothetical protein
VLAIVRNGKALLLTYITGWTILAGPIARLVHLWGELTLCMALSITSYYYLVELQTSLRRIGSENSDKWHCRVVNGYLLLA